MITPRNSLVVLRLIEQSEKKIGKFVVIANKEEYAEAEVIAVGPGSILSGGARSENFDLTPGQRVFVKHKQWGRSQLDGRPQLQYAGIEYRQGEEVYYIFEQGNVLGIVAEPYPNDAKTLCKQEN